MEEEFCYIHMICYYAVAGAAEKIPQLRYCLEFFIAAVVILTWY